MDNVLGAVDKQLKNYPNGDRAVEALERAVKVQGAMLAARQADGAKGEAYFRDLVTKYGASNEAKSKILMGLATYLDPVDAKRAGTVRSEAVALVPKATEKEIKDSDGNVIGKEMVRSFLPPDWDRILSDQFDAKKYDEMKASIARVREEYPLTETPPMLVQDAQAVCLFWEGKILEEQGKIADAGAKFAELAAKYPTTTKRMEADYGIINGKFVSGALKTEVEQRLALKRLNEIVGVSKAKTFELQAKALLLVGRINETLLKDYDNAIMAYAKVADFFSSVPKVASEGLWRAAGLLERQASKDLPVLLPDEKADASKRARELMESHKKAEDAKNPKADPKAVGGKPDDAKPADAKPGDKKPADTKAADKTTAAAPAQK